MFMNDIHLRETVECSDDCIDDDVRIISDGVWHWLLVIEICDYTSNGG